MSKESEALAKVDKSEKEMRFVPFGAEDEIKLSIAIIKNLIAVKTKSGKTCSDNDAIKFMMMCQARKLNPFEGDAFLIGYDGRDGATFSLITAHQAFLKRAELNAEYDGMKSGIIVEEAGALVDLEGDFHTNEQKPVGGWAIVYFKNRTKPMKKRVRLARFQKAFGVWQDDPAGMICKCFDEQTEVLTDRGFEKFATAEGRILQVTERGLEPTDAVPFCKPYTGPMVEYQSRNGNFKVTPNHDIPISLNGQTERKLEAGCLLKLRKRDRASMPLTIAGTRRDNSLPADALRLAAAYIADGSDNSRSSGFSIAVSRPHKIEFLSELGLQTSCCLKRDAGGKGVLSSGRAITTKSNKMVFYYSRGTALESIVSRGKKINLSTVLELSMRQARILLDVWISMDGHRQKQMRYGRIYTSRLDHANAIGLIAVVAGLSVSNIRCRASDGGKDRYEITITDRTSVAIDRSLLKTTSNEPDGKVWCVTVPTHKIVVRRLGFSAVCFQCAEADALRSSFPTMLGGLYLKEELNNTEKVEKLNEPVFTELPEPEKPALIEVSSEPVVVEVPVAKEPVKKEKKANPVQANPEYPEQVLEDRILKSGVSVDDVIKAMVSNGSLVQQYKSLGEVLLHEPEVFSLIERQLESIVETIESL